MEAIYSSPDVVQSIGDFLTVRYTGVRAVPPPFLVSVSEAITTLGTNVPLELGTLLPTDRRRRYEWLEALKKGLGFPLVHVTHAPGGSIGNLHWVWHSTSSSTDKALMTAHATNHCKL